MPQKKTPNKKKTYGGAHPVSRSGLGSVFVHVYTQQYSMLEIGNTIACIENNSLHLNYSSFTSSWDYIQVRWKRRNDVWYEKSL